jgi:HEPN domain-containing protein
MTNSINGWLQAASDDLAAMKAMMPNAQLTNIIAFHAQQAVEKAFKGLREQLELAIPRSHDLLLLYDGLSEHIVASEDSLDSLNQLYIDARYPGDMGLLPDGKPSVKEADEFDQFAKMVVNAATQATRNSCIEDAEK